jgi:hypothetical protein
MDTKLFYLGLTRHLRVGVFSLVSMTSFWAPAATVWSGPNKTWTKSPSTPSDTIVAGKVVLTRGNNQVLINTAAGESAAGPASPADTEWAFGDITNFSTLTYQSMESLRNGDLALRILNKPMVMHLKNEDIYLSVKFTVWGQFFSGTVSYVRSTPAVAVTPSVTITNPVSGATFSAPADVKIAANATATGGTVTNVSFFGNAAKLGSVQIAPFTFTAAGLTAGTYALTAVATAGGISATSAVVNITVVSPTSTSLSAPSLSGGSFSFHYSTDPGLKYVIEKSANLLNWSPINTNVAAGSSAVFSEPVAGNSADYYRVGRLPNP